jgi:predicted N-acetyltransferase YhbS
MEIRSIAPDERTDFLALVDAEIRPPGARTRALDDFPVILGVENAAWQLVAVEAGALVGCLAVLVRRLTSVWGPLAVGGIGSVVTVPEQRGRGLSRRLQEEALVRLRRQDVPLAVLWTDRPEIYAGRGFRPAGVEFHVDLARARFAGASPQWARVEEYGPARGEVVASIYAEHPLHTLREPGDAERLYGMPGTRGLVAVDADGIVAGYAFCGKGADFPHYVLEWGGERAAVLALVDHAVGRGLARHVLVPQGGEDLVDLLVDRGAGWFALPSGCWKVLDPEALRARGAEQGWRPSPGADPADPRTWLGGVDEQGDFATGPLALAIWGFDSV